MPTINPACTPRFSLSLFPVRMCVWPLPPSRYKHRTRASLLARRSLSLVILHRYLSLPLVCRHPPHFRATRSVLLSLQPPAFSLLTFSLYLSLFLFPSVAFSLFPSHSTRSSLPILPTPDTRHPIPNYVKRFRILWPDYAASLPSHSLSLSPHCFLFVSFALARALDCCIGLSLSRVRRDL